MKKRVLTSVKSFQLKQLILWILVSLYTPPIFSQNNIQINIPTAEEEAEYVWRNIQDIKFFDQYGYQAKFPTHSLLDSLLEKSRQNSLEEADYEDLLDLMKEEIYARTDYQNGFQKIDQHRALINQLINRHKSQERRWSFKAFDSYQINLSLYGPGGSYNNEDGSILLFTTKEGSFKQYENPSNTIIHEIIHIGIEESIIQNHKISHPDKERIVDRYVSIMFGGQLSDYRVQNMGNKDLDELLQTKEDLYDLESKIVKYSEGN
ncbi:MAG: hypothetical protein AAF696_26125 [Bacteroidota bacterium]